jgi:hypothetical protein
MKWTHFFFTLQENFPLDASRDNYKNCNLAEFFFNKNYFL